MGNPVSDLPADVDSFLQDVAQMYGGIDYTDIMQAKLSKKQLSNIRKYHGKLCDLDVGTDEAKAIVQRVNNIVKLNKEN